MRSWFLELLVFVIKLSMDLVKPLPKAHDTAFEMLKYALLPAPEVLDCRLHGPTDGLVLVRQQSFEQFHVTTLASALVLARFGLAHRVRSSSLPGIRAIILG